jgi:AbrB family looped-hinge helix DNA binding protein
MNTGTLSEKGWVVIPRELRERYHLKKGDKVHFIDYGGMVAIVPISREPVRDAAGMLKGRTSLTAALLKERQDDKARGA